MTKRNTGGRAHVRPFTPGKGEPKNGSRAMERRYLIHKARHWFAPRENLPDEHEKDSA